MEFIKNIPGASYATYSAAIKIPPYGKLLQIFCIFYNLLDDANKTKIREIINNDIFLKQYSSKFDTLTSLCVHETGAENIKELVENQKTSLQPFLDKLEIQDIQGTDFKKVLNTEITKLIEFIAEQKEGIKTAFDQIKIGGGNKKKGIIRFRIHPQRTAKRKRNNKKNKSRKYTTI